MIIWLLQINMQSYRIWFAINSIDNLFPQLKVCVLMFILFDIEVYFFKVVWYWSVITIWVPTRRRNANFHGILVYVNLQDSVLLECLMHIILLSLWMPQVHFWLWKRVPHRQYFLLSIQWWGKFWVIHALIWSSILLTRYFPCN